MKAELETFAGRFELDGGEVMLEPQAAQSFELALHELATNAVKYGALSVPGGKVAVRWRMGSGSTLRFRWQERSGPAVSPPKETGFGTSLLKATLGEGRIEYPVEGLTYEVEVSLDRVVLAPV